MRYLFQGADKRITLGSYPVLGLKEAREKAFKQKKLLDQGKDPLAERQVEAEIREKSKTFLEAGQAWEASFLDRLAGNTTPQKKVLLSNYIYPVIGDILIADLEPYFLLNKEKTTHEHGPVTVLRELRNKLDAAVAEAYGWPVDLSDEEVLSRLAPLNTKRVEEKKNGLIR